MVKKLIKHEFIYYGRTLGILLPVILALGLMARIFRVLDNGSGLTFIMVFSSVSMLIIGAIGLALFTMLLSIVRFYKNLYSAEGYLTFTLPINCHQHLLVKLLASVTSTVVVYVLIIAAMLIAFLDDPAGLFRWFGDFIVQVFTGEYVLSNILYVIQGFLVVSIGIVMNPLLYFACITIGQLAKKNRILLAIAAYFIHYAVTQALGTIVTMFFILLDATGIFPSIPELILALGEHFVLFILIFGMAGATALYYFVTIHIMKNKLNLE